MVVLPTQSRRIFSDTRFCCTAILVLPILSAITASEAVPNSFSSSSFYPDPPPGFPENAAIFNRTRFTVTAITVRFSFLASTLS